jgi:hypothetical protein
MYQVNKRIVIVRDQPNVTRDRVWIRRAKSLMKHL